MQGLVIRSTGSWYRLLCEDTIYECRLRGNYRLNNSKQTNPIAVGDIAFFSLQEDGMGVINDIADRKNYIVRRATKLSKQTHVIAANIDLMCIVATISSPRTSTGFIDRMLVTAEAYHIPACIIVNKCDLHDDNDNAALQQLMDIYPPIGYPIEVVSARKGVGIEKMKQRILGKTVLFSGHSGVGKSAILNAIDPSLNLKVGAISDWSNKGKHTTTFAQIFPLRDDNQQPMSYLIDTPGIKEFGIVDFSKQELSHFFPEMHQYQKHCRYNNCTHTHEPQCAVKQAIEEGHLSPERYHNYLNMLNEGS